MSLNRKKYQNAVLYLCRKLKGEVRGKKKLAKLLYFADFDLYEKIQKSITGDVYNALPMGPVPSALEEITQEMAKGKMLGIEQVGHRKRHRKNGSCEFLASSKTDCIEKPYIFHILFFVSKNVGN